MTANFTLDLTLKGNEDELLKMLSVYDLYTTGEKGVYFDTTRINGASVGLGIDQEDWDEYITDGKVEIEAAGPYGKYSELSDLECFEEMANAAPDAEFKAHIGGSVSSMDQSLQCELKDGIVKFETYSVDYDDVVGEWGDHYRDIVSPAELLNICQIEEDDVPEEQMEEFRERFRDIIYDGFLYADYKSFKKALKELHLTTAIKTKSAFQAMIQSLGDIGLSDPEYYQDEYEGDRNTYTYNPKTGEYEGDEPDLEDLDISDATYEITEGRKLLCLPYDDETIENLSVEEAYEALNAYFDRKHKK